MIDSGIVVLLLTVAVLVTEVSVGVTDEALGVVAGELVRALEVRQAAA